MKGIQIKEFEVVKVTPKSFKVAFNAETRKYPQLMRKGEISVIDSDKKRLALNTINFVKEQSKWPGYLKKKIINYCKRIIKIEDVKKNLVRGESK